MFFYQNRIITNVLLEYKLKTYKYLCLHVEGSIQIHCTENLPSQMHIVPTHSVF